MNREDAHLSFWEHIGVLRNYLLVAAALLVVFASVAFTYGDEPLLRLLLAPLHGEKLLFLSPLGPFLFKIKVSIYAAVVIAFPFWLGLLLRFVSPALPAASRVVLAVFACCSTLLGFASLAFTYLYFLPVTLTVLRGFTVPGTELLLTAENYLSFCLLELFVVFVVLQIPIIMVALSYVRVLNPAVLAGHRRAAIIGIVIALAVVTPTTDVVTLLVVSVPAIVLWEVGLAISKLVYNRRVL